MPDPRDGPAVRLSFDRAPGSVLAFLKALVDRRPASLPEHTTSPRIVGVIDRISWRPRLLRRYARVCGFPAGPVLPLPFPHIVGSGLHLRMLLHPEFPVRLPGLVHVWHRISMLRPIDATRPLSMECWIEGHRDVDAGAEFCLHTRLLSGDVALWEEQTGFIARASRRSRSGSRSSGETDHQRVVMSEVARIDATADIGRRYARASGDYNPIHLSAATARPFGFPRPIAHGMWTLARCVAELERRGGPVAGEAFVRFKRPVFLPSTLRLEASEDDGSRLTFRVLDVESGTVCLTGRLGKRVSPAADATG